MLNSVPKKGFSATPKVSPKSANYSSKSQDSGAARYANAAPEAGDRAPAAGSSLTDRIAPNLKTKQVQAAKIEAIRKSLVFTQVVSLMMRSPLSKEYRLTDLEWLVLPALQRDQFKIAEATTGDVSVPAGFLLWAKVSPEVDKRLSETSNTPMRLMPDEWNSGEIVWVIETVGDPRALKELLKHVRDTVAPGRDVKFRTTSREGKASVASLAALNLDQPQHTSAP
jgi:hemolysin-activating ACP:hemolysin acyltransferase